MKIAIFHDLPSGGAKRTLYELVKRLAQNHCCDVYTLSTADHSFCDLRPWVAQHNIYDYTPNMLFNSPLGRLNPAQRVRDLIRLDRLHRQIAADIDRQGHDVVFVHPCQWTQAPPLICYLKTPVVYFLQELPRHLYPEDWQVQVSGWRSYLDKVDPLLALYRSRAKRLDYLATRRSKRVLVNSQFMGTVVSNVYGIRPNVSYLGVDIDLFRPHVDVGRHAFILSVGAINPAKGFDFIIQSLGLIKPDIRPPLHIVGNVSDPRESQRLFSIAHQRNVCLVIETSLDPAQLVERYNQARLFTYAPHNEPFGLAPLEAMACGRTVVGVAEAGVKETVLDGLTGLLVEREHERLAKAIEWLLTHPDECREYEQRAVEIVRQRWTWDQAVHRVEMHLQAVAA